ncbi:endonuclease/exonuclease/phosphatase family protein [Archangium sp.]|uniref:endonuclease/exonuclease/phosphatase family protein n=1 Tax=Archangium sp. TaxID=1872627 RepID=UPI00389A6027
MEVREKNKMPTIQRQTLRTVLVTLAFIGGLVAVLSPPEAQARHVDRSRLNVMQLNIAGWSINKANLAVADRLVDSVADRAPGLPLAVSVNEVCFQQWERLYNRLQVLGYTGHFGPSIFHDPKKDPACEGKAFGNAIFWLGGHAEAKTFWIPDSHQIHGAATEEKRNMVCGRPYFPERTWYCSVHLVNGEDTHSREVRRQQADDIRAIANVLNTEHRAIIMGDFNMSKDEPAMQQWFNGFWLDADNDRDGRPTWRSTKNKTITRKLDYIMVRADRFSFGHDAFIIEVAGSTDHWLVQGYPVFK